MARFEKAVLYLIGKGHLRSAAEAMVNQFPHAAESWADEYDFWHKRSP